MVGEGIETEHEVGYITARSCRLFT